MTTVKDIFDYLNEFAPCERKMDFDNVGFLVGTQNTEVKKILVALDVTDEVIDEAVEKNAQLIVSHHPMFFSLNTVNDTEPVGRKITKLLSNGISAICMHTNLDGADGGVNDALADALDILDTELISVEGTDKKGTDYSYGRIGHLSRGYDMTEFLPLVKEKLHTSGLRYHSAEKPVYKIAVVGGSGGSYLGDAIAQGCDTLLTADIKYDVFLSAKEAGINIIDADHFCTENTVVPVLKNRLSEKFENLSVIVSERHKQTVNFL